MSNPRRNFNIACVLASLKEFLLRPNKRAKVLTLRRHLGIVSANVWSAHGLRESSVVNEPSNVHLENTGRPKKDYIVSWKRRAIPEAVSSLEDRLGEDSVTQAKNSCDKLNSKLLLTIRRQWANARWLRVSYKLINDFMILTNVPQYTWLRRVSPVIVMM